MGGIWGGRWKERHLPGVGVGRGWMELQVLEGSIGGALADRLGLCGLQTDMRGAEEAVRWGSGLGRSRQEMQV